MIKVSNLYKTFHPGKTNEVKALHGIDLEIKAGEFLVIVGANGSGKSTLLNSISGSVLQGSGELSIDGNAITSLAEHRRSKWIARVFQNPLMGTAGELSVLENFRLASLRTKKKGLTIGIDETFKNTVREKISELGMGLENKILQPMSSLSGGQRQALTLLMAVMDDVRILLLDEPTAALDPRSAEIVMKTADKLISDYKLTALLITHNMKEAFNYGNRIIQMVEGRIVRDLDKNEKIKLSHTDLYEWFM
ncbi:ATP-binding cassette domain-containing protein [Pedobacter sp. P351]|uniref:ABC transporter ATP-binding protein n=1 Tax=Pedobacter superstes TaxID=3133441 RepID=UPI0030AA954B